MAASASVPTSTAKTSKEQLDFLVSSAKQEDETQIITRLQRFVVEATTSPLRRLYEAEASINHCFAENEFYTADELQILLERGQPPTKRNEMAPILERIAGQFIQTRQRVTFLGRNTPQDDPVANLAKDYQAHNDTLNQIEFEEQEQVWDGNLGGVGWLKSYITTNELGQKYNKVRSVNPFHIYKDPYSVRYDPNDDAKYIMEGSWMDQEDGMALFPDKEDAIRDYISSGYGGSMPHIGNIAASLQNEQGMPGSMYALSVQGTGGRARIRPFEIWYKRKIKVYYLLNQEGVVALPVPLDAKQAHAVLKQAGDDFILSTVLQDRMYTGVLLGSLLLHHDVSEHVTNLFPYIPYYSGLKKNGLPLPLASRLVPLVEAINKRESKALAALSNNQAIVEKNAVEDPEAFQIEKARPDGLMEVREGALSQGKVLLRANTEIGQGQLALLQEDKDAILRVAGQEKALEEPSEIRSGSGMARKQMVGAQVITPLHANLRRSRFMRARLAHAYMKQYLTEEMSFQITDDPNAPRVVQMTKGAIQALKERVYDIVLTEEKDYAVLREQQAEMLLTVLPQLAPLGPGMVKLGIQLTELRDKEGLIKMIDQQSSTGPAMPKISLSQDWKDLTPEMQAYYALTAYQSPELAQAIMQAGEDPAFLKKLKADLINTQIKEGTRATVERGRVDLSALQTAIEGRMHLRQEFQPPAQGAAPA